VAGAEDVDGVADAVDAVAEATVAGASMRLLLALVVPLAIGGCQTKPEGKKKPEFKRVLGRIHSAVAPADLEWPLKRMSELRTKADKPDVQMAARFELARGWLRLGVLSGVGRDSAEADRVMASTGMKTPKDILAEFEKVASAESVKETNLPTWSKEGARLATALLDNVHADVTEIALAGGSFSPEASAIVFTYLIRLLPKPAEGVKAPPAKLIGRQLRQVVRYACPDAAKLLKPTEGGPDKTARLTAFAAACAKASWFEGVDLKATAASSPCASLEVTGAGVEAKTVLAAFFNLLLTSYEKLGPNTPPLIASRFPVAGACQEVNKVQYYLGAAEEAATPKEAPTAETPPPAETAPPAPTPPAPSPAPAP